MATEVVGCALAYCGSPTGKSSTAIARMIRCITGLLITPPLVLAKSQFSLTVHPSGQVARVGTEPLSLVTGSSGSASIRRRAPLTRLSCRRLRTAWHAPLSTVSAAAATRSAASSNRDRHRPPRRKNHREQRLRRCKARYREGHAPSPRNRGHDLFKKTRAEMKR